MSVMITRKIFCLTLSFMIVLLIIRARVLNLELSNLIVSMEIIPQLILASYYDWMFAVMMAGFFISLTFIASNNDKAVSVIFIFFVAAVLLCILFALLNKMAVRMLKVPLNYQWVYYSDFFGNAEARKGFLTFLSWPLWKNFLILSSAALGGSLLFHYISLKVGSRNYLIGMSTIICLFIFYFIIAFNFIEKANKNYNKLANPLVSFVNSIFVSFKDPNRFFSKSAPERREPFEVNSSSKKSFHRNPQSKIRNVIIYVLESVPAEYVSGYRNKYSVTPNIEEHLHQSLVFSDIYAHFPATNSSMVSILTSMYPMISYKSVSKEYPRINWPSISSELKSNNYRTAFFHASDNRFQKMDEFLSVRKFDEICDYRDIHCNKNILVGSTPTWKFLDGIDEECMVDAFTEWLIRDKKEKSFFAMLWTIQTHYPYFPKGKEIIYVKDNPDLNRYLNALHQSDAMLGKLLEDLEKTRMMESTLVVVIGDHGEAFGRHDQMGHGAEIYEENVKVPLIFINPEFKGEKISVIGGQIDLAPTLMDLLGRPSPREWEGVSLFDSTRINRTFFFNPHSFYLFGYREGKYKVIFNASWNETMIYDLSKDPEEKHNIAEKMPELVKKSEKYLGGWVQYHSAVMDEKISQLETQKKSSVQ
jgi:lipoteichoic acid synthase